MTARPAPARGGSRTATSAGAYPRARNRRTESATTVLADPAVRAERGSAGQRIVAENRGALDRLMRLLQPLLDEFPDR